MKPEGASGGTNGQRSKIGGLNQHVNGRFTHLAISAAHDSSEGDGSRLFGDDTHTGTKNILAMVDCHKGLVFGRPANDDLATLQMSEVERMQRLSSLHHHVVRNVHNVADHG